MTTWYDDCQDGYPWWRITGQVYWKYFAIPPGGGAIEELTETIHQDLVSVGAGTIARQLGLSPRAVAFRANRLGYRFIGPRTGGRWVAPKEAA